MVFDQDSVRSLVKSIISLNHKKFRFYDHKPILLASKPLKATLLKNTSQHQVAILLWPCQPTYFHGVLKSSLPSFSVLNTWNQPTTMPLIKRPKQSLTASSTLGDPSAHRCQYAATPAGVGISSPPPTDTNYGVQLHCTVAQKHRQY